MSELSASDMQPAIDSDAEWSQLMVSQMARSIEIANSVNPNSWCVPTWQGIPVAAVGQITILSLGPTTSYGFFISTEDYQGPDLESLPGLEVTTRSYTTTPWGGYLRLDEDHLVENLSILRAAHEAGVKRLAEEANGRAQRWKEHQSSIVEMVRKLSGLPIPDPGYIDEIPAAEVQGNGLQTRRYWKIDCGGAGKDWPLMLQHGRCAHSNWAREPIELNQLPVEHDAFVAAMIEYPGIQKPAAEHCWRFFHEMSIGDLVVAINSQKSYGWGEITGDYEYLTENGLGEHQRTVDWAKELSPQSLKNMSQELRDAIWGIGPRELSSGQFAEAIGEQTAVQESSVSTPNMKSDLPDVQPLEILPASFQASGLHYTESQIAAFYTALQTKGFVVLSGISGTGKSKIATGFVEMMPAPSSSAPVVADSSGMISVSIKPYMRTYKRFILPARQVDLLPPLEVGNQHEVSVTLDGMSGEGRIEHRAHSGSSSIMVVYFKGEIGKAVANLELGTRLYLRPVVDDDGDAIEHIDLLRDSDLVAESSAEKSAEVIPNHLFLAVRPDWRDSTSLLGYYNPLTENYEWTDFLKFLIRAGENYQGPPGDRIAWFVILDEMNLAHVEYYFADLLSVIESGRNAEGWTAEPLRLTYPDALEDEAPPRELFLPPNLYFIGTVNMDETTHAFSPKVLDRAFTIELTDVDFRDYPPSGAALGGEGLDDTTKAAMLAAFSRDGKFAQIDKREIAEFIERFPEARDQLQALNDVLRPFRMHFGYRVFDEVTQYLANNDQNGMATFEEAFDQAVFMKVLPKFSGSRARLLSPLHGVFAWAIDPLRTSRDDVENAVEGLVAYERGKTADAWEASPAFPRVAERVRDMLVALERDGFVSFG